MKEKIAMLAAVLFGAACLTVASAAGAGTPSKYRYTGVVGPIAEIASHFIVEGDGLRFFFGDREAFQNGEPYRVCVAQAGKAPFQCWNRRIVRNRINDRFTIGDFPNPRFGALVARWYVNGRVVATWPFLYVVEGE